MKGPIRTLIIICIFVGDLIGTKIINKQSNNFSANLNQNQIEKSQDKDRLVVKDSNLIKDNAKSEKAENSEKSTRLLIGEDKFYQNKF